MQALLVIFFLANFSQMKPNAAAMTMNPAHPLVTKPNQPIMKTRLSKNFRLNNQLNKQGRPRVDYLSQQNNQLPIAAATSGLTWMQGHINRGHINIGHINRGRIHRGQVKKGQINREQRNNEQTKRREINSGNFNVENKNRIQMNQGHVNRGQINRQISRTNLASLDKILERIEDMDLLLTTKMVKWLTQRVPFLYNFWKIPFPDGLKSKNMTYWFPEQVLCKYVE